MKKSDIVAIENIIGYKFRDKNLLIKAMTHSSFLNENKGSESYEKLEFFGDSILNFIVAEDLFMTAINDEGEMTVRRAKIVSKKPLCEAVSKMNIYKYVRFGRGLNSKTVSEKAKSDIFESILAAIYIDSNRNMDEARKYVKQHLKMAIAFAMIDYKSTLQEYAQGKKITLVYGKAIQIGQNNQPVFLADVVLDERIRGEGTGRTIKEAQQNAARMVLEQIEHEKI